jgi:uncharacterized protein
MSELTDAIKSGDASRISAIVEADAAKLSEPENGVTPLLLAIYHGKPDIACQLVDRGAPVSFAEACALGDSARAEKLLGGDPTAVRSRSTDGFPALGLAIFFGHGELARWLIERGADVNAAAENAARVAPVHAAAAVCDRETMRALLAAGADANACQQMDHTPLHGAASRGDVEMAKLLLAHGANRDARTADGLGPAEIARKYGKPEFAEWFERG